MIDSDYDVLFVPNAVKMKMGVNVGSSCGSLIGAC